MQAKDKKQSEDTQFLGVLQVLQQLDYPEYFIAELVTHPEDDLEQSPLILSNSGLLEIRESLTKLQPRKRISRLSPV